MEPVRSAEYFHVEIIVSNGSDNLLDSLTVDGPPRNRNVTNFISMKRSKNIIMAEVRYAGKARVNRI